MFRKILHPLGSLVLVASAFQGRAQNDDDAVRVTVTMNPNGSKTVYQTNGASHQATATTTGADGKTRGKILYQLDGQGRYESGQVFAANGAFRFKTLYLYDAAGRLTQETQLAKDGTLRNKIVYIYDAAGHQTGYAVYDGAGLLLGRTSATNPGASTKNKKAR